MRYYSGLTRWQNCVQASVELLADPFQRINSWLSWLRLEYIDRHCTCSKCKERARQKKETH